MKMNKKREIIQWKLLTSLDFIKPFQKECFFWKRARLDVWGIYMCRSYIRLVPQPEKDSDQNGKRHAKPKFDN